MQITPINTALINNLAGNTKIATCPHGMSFGGCPACSSGGGGGSSKVADKPTPKELGLLTWADLLPGWLALQAAKARQEYNENVSQNLLLQRIMQNKLLNLANERLSQAFKFISGNLSTLTSLFQTRVLPSVKNLVQNTVQALTQDINVVMNQLKEQAKALVNNLSPVVKDVIENTYKFAVNFLNETIGKIFATLTDKDKSLIDNLKRQLVKLNNKVPLLLKAVESLFNHKDQDDNDQNSDDNHSEEEEM